MSSAAPLLPPSASLARVRPQAFVLAVGALVPATWALAGIYPQFDNGKLRYLIAATTALLALLLVRTALRTPTRLAAVGCTIGGAMLLGVLNTVIPAVVLTWGDSGLGVALMFGLFCGAPTGLVYGVPLAALIGGVHEGLRSTSLDAAERVRVRAGVWGFVCAALAVGFAATLPVLETSRPVMLSAATVPVFALVVGVASALRLRTRRQWSTRVRAGLEPLLSVRERKPSDPMELPCFGEGPRVSVVEWTPSLVDAPGAYRLAACGVPVALLAEAEDRVQRTRHDLPKVGQRVAAR